MTMLTRWGRALDPNAVLPEYPRPQLVRGSYINLNGYWDYAITRGNDALYGYDGQILVPFSPEAPLSGVGRTLSPEETLWYRRAIPAERRGGERLILHFGAVDQEAEVYINDSLVASHCGGYTAFEVDITDFISDGENILTVRVKDATDTNEYTHKARRHMVHPPERHMADGVDGVCAGGVYISAADNAGRCGIVRAH